MENRPGPDPSSGEARARAFDLCAFVRVSTGGLCAPHGGTVFPLAGSLSAVAPSVSSHRWERNRRKNSCGGRSHSARGSLGRSRDEFLRMIPGRAGFLIKNDGLPFALRERTSQPNATGLNHSVGLGAVRNRRSLPLAFKIRFGRTLWKSLHGLADGWPCARCRPLMLVWMQGLHDAVNVRLGKPPFRPDSYAQYASGLLERGFHAGCFGCRVARAVSRFLARAPRPQIWNR